MVTAPRAWEQHLDKIQQGIDSGQFEKVVAARRTLLTLDSPPELAVTLSHLLAQASGCTPFAFRTQGKTFLGATPEHLVRREGQAIWTEALASSIRSTDPDAASKLQHSPKDQREHELVVRDIVERLEELTTSLEYPKVPEVRRLRHLLHLRTPIRAQLKKPLHVLDLVARLHPTPAVGGFPKQAALDWIARHEDLERGWYGAPIGWFDAQGDGEFCVALRSGLVDGVHAHLYAGAGIVRDSVATSEYQETEDKFALLSGALGVDR